MKRKLLLGASALLFVWIATIALAITVVKVRVPISLPPANIALNLDYVTARGTWVIEGHKQAFPLQTTQINCEKRLRRCTSATAEVGAGDQLYLDVSSHDIVEWNQHHVVFTDERLCVRYLYTIDLITKSATGLRERKAKPITDAICSDLEEQSLRLSLRGGTEVEQKLAEEAMPWFGEVVLAPFRLWR